MTAEKGKRPGWPPSVYPKTTISVTAYDPTIKLSRQIRPILKTAIVSGAGRLPPAAWSWCDAVVRVLNLGGC